MLQFPKCCQHNVRVFVKNWNRRVLGVQECQDIKLDDQFLDVAEKVFLGDTIGAGGCAGNCVLARIRNRWSMSRNLWPLFTKFALRSKK